MTKYTACFSRQEIELFFEPPENTVLISITDPKSEVVETGPWMAVLQLQFWDVEKLIQGYEPATEEQIKIIHMFINSHDDMNIFIHCEAGVSRSAAIREYLRRRGWEYWGNNGLREVYPNGYILSHLERLDFPERQYE